MSDDAFDFTTGYGQGPGDWSNESRVQGHIGRLNYEATQASLNPPPTSTNYGNTSDDSMTWGVRSDYSSSSNYSSGSYSGGSSGQDVNLTSSEVVTGLGLLLGGYAGYSFAVAYRGTSLELWLTTGGAALSAALMCHLVVAVIKGKMQLSAAAGIVIMTLIMSVSAFAGYLYADIQHGSTLELWLAAAVASFGAMFVWTFVTDIFKADRSLFTLGSILAMLLGAYAGHTYYDGTPLQDWLAGGVGALTAGICAWVTGETIKNVANQQPAVGSGSTAKKAKSN